MNSDNFVYGLLSPNTSQKYANIENYEGFNQNRQTAAQRGAGGLANYPSGSIGGQRPGVRQHTPRNTDGTPREKPTRISKLIDLFFADYFVDSYEDSDIDETPKLKKQVEEYKAREAKYIQEIDTLTIHNNDLATQLEEFNDNNHSTVVTLEQRIDSLTSENVKIREEMDLLKEELVVLKKSSKSTRYAIEDYEQQLKQQRTKNNSLIEDLASAQAEASMLNGKIADLSASLAYSEQQCANMAKKLAQERENAASELCAARTDNAKLRIEYERVLTELQETHAAHRERIRLLEDDRGRLQNELRESKIDLQSSIKEANDFKRKSIALSMPIPTREMTMALTNKDEEIHRLNLTISSLEERHRTTIKEVEAAHELLSADMVAKDKALLKSKAEIAGLSEQLDAMIKHKLELQSRIGFLERVVKDKDEAIESIQDRAGAAQTAVALSNGQHSIDVSALRAQIKEKNCEITRLQDEMRNVLQSKNAEINALKLNVTTLTERVREYRDRLMESGSPSSSKVNDLKLLQVLGKESSSTHDSTESEIGALEKELSIKNILIKKKDEDIDFFRSQLVLREAEIERLLSSQTSTCSKQPRTPLKAVLKKSKSKS
ncbi:Intracellular protein transport protein USO1 [Giardia duodenalis]|uniref:Intracellular protein transport protein USO1 n=1 Tax=Giardia intestinalis (strain ATCC 50803 / WB clone C6) TaxID=184922 RepID=A8B544_GIAIC|nr:Intracellular protein transport protein USO1 [Giardia intestinalis]KAE8303836.1 Intracellular protein transport protein USO1 [Giardia intestinalis]|eukprot:XP_001709771.1 Intracellular protein transport protein USO1 [Giardia lamblia ATCC 50803]